MLNLCGNYRGIAINDIFFRLYDKIMCKRLSSWYRPTREQAGSQKASGCLEHIIMICVLIDFAKKSVLVNQGIKQGSSSSSRIFIIYVDRLVKLIDENCREDGFLSVLHILTVYMPHQK